jgi:acyl-coenzyme A synthetase/AMP-(fatty) acid ligase
LQQLANARHGRGEPAVRDIISAGEALQLTPEIRDFVEGLRDCRLHNHYGPTETHVVTSYQLEADTGIWLPEASIGRPIANTQVYILNDALHPVPIGITGELYIGGAGLARGYLNRPELTAERFIEIEILGRSERVYRTGDLCRWRADGNLEFLERMDHQVKIRGYRIELGEIEAVLSAQPGIKESVVLAREDTPGEKRLVAYMVLDQENPATTPALRRALAEQLPDYMLPVAFVPLDTLPLTANGKLDRRGLPAPDFARPELDSGYVAPRTMVEEQLSGVWRELLGLEQIGIHDNFFEMGGHSLMIARLAGVINERLGSNLMIGEVYRSPTIAEMANLLEHPAEPNSG